MLDTVHEAVLKINLKRKKHHFIIISEDIYDEYMLELEEDERYEDMAYMRDNKKNMVKHFPLPN